MHLLSPFNCRNNFNYNLALALIIMVFTFSLTFTHGINTLNIYDFETQDFRNSTPQINWDSLIKYPPLNHLALSTLLLFIPHQPTISLYTNQPAWQYLKLIILAVYFLTLLTLVILLKLNSRTLKSSIPSITLGFLASIPIQLSSVSLSFFDIFAAPTFILSLSFLIKKHFVKAAFFNLVAVFFNWSLLIFSPIFFIYTVRQKNYIPITSWVSYFFIYILLPASFFVMYCLILIENSSIFLLYNYPSAISGLATLIKIYLSQAANLNKFFLLSNILIFIFFCFYFLILYTFRHLKTLSITSLLLSLFSSYLTLILFFPTISSGNLIYPLIVGLLLYAYTKNSLVFYLLFSLNLTFFINLFASYGIAGNPTITGAYFDFFKIIFSFSLIFLLGFGIYLALKHRLQIPRQKAQIKLKKLLRYFLIFLIICINLSFITASGTPDHLAWREYALAATQYNPFQAHVVAQQLYPPLSTLIISVFANTWKILIGPDSTYHTANKIGIFTFYLISIICYLVYAKAFQKGKLFSIKNNIVFLLSIFSLAIHTQGWGEIDIYTLPTQILAIIYFFKGRTLLSGLLMGITISIKWQPIIYLPIFLAFLVNHQKFKTSLHKLKTYLLGLSIPPIISWGLVIIQPGGINEFLTAAGYLLKGPPLFSGLALNLNWVITYLLHIFDPINHFSLSTFNWFNYPIAADKVPFLLLKPLFFYLAVTVILTKFWLNFKKDLLHSLYALFMISFSHYILNIGAYDKHIFYALVIIILIYLSKPTSSSLKLLTLIDVMAIINFVIFFGLTGTREINSIFFNLDLTVPLALLYTVIYIWIFCRYLKGKGEIYIN